MLMMTTQLMPIDGNNAPVDVAPEPLRLDQVSVDNAIVSILETEEIQKAQDIAAPQLLNESHPGEVEIPVCGINDNTMDKMTRNH